MRTTITLTPDAEAVVKEAMARKGIGFKQAVNEAIIASRPTVSPVRAKPTPSFDLGRASVPLERALQLAGELEDEELMRKRALGT